MRALRTRVSLTESPWKITHRDRVLLAGSCFAGHMRDYLQERGVRSFQPFGPLFNPVSVSDSLRRLREGRPVTEEELFEEGGLWHHFGFHGNYSRPSKSEALAEMNHCVEEGGAFLEAAKVVILTLGTAYVYERSDTREVVANCHHAPASAFRRRRLSVSEAAGHLDDVIRLIPGKRLILTVSPIRHTRDGLHENNLSKSVLLLAIEEFRQRHPEADYFPSYEMLTDDLRDYRFYADDLTHPAPLAVEYIGERFTERYWDDATREAARAFAEIRKRETHRPLHPGSAGDETFRQETARLRARWEEEHYGPAR